MPEHSHTQRGLDQYVPRIATEWDASAEGRSWQELDATLCFVDISGFTNLSERLARFGRIGAEELTAVLNRVFGSMLELAYAQGGSLLKFGGDALLLLFHGDDHALRGVSAAVEMRDSLRRMAAEKTSVGRLRLRMSVGIHTGPIYLFRAGHTHYELVITGHGGTSTTEMEKAAKPGEIVISQGTKGRLADSAATTPREGGWLLKWRTPKCTGTESAEARAKNGSEAEDWVPTELREFLLAADPEPEHRLATVGFVRFCETDSYLEEHGPEALASQVDATVAAIQDAADAEGVTFLATDINEDGGKVILVAGAPTSKEDDEGRMLRTVRRIVERETPLHVHIGVNRGHVFSGEVGTPYRATYTVIGDTVNVAARLAAAAPASEIYSMPDVLDRSRTLFDVATLEPFMVKGKDEPVQAYAVGAETGDRSTEVVSELPFVGRTKEMGALRELVARWDSGEGGVATIVGDTGTGKSRLVQESLAEMTPTTLLSLRAEPYGAADPYRPFRDFARRLFGIESASATEAAQQLEAAVVEIDKSLLPLAPLLGDLAHIEIPATPESAAIEPQFRRDRLADVLISLLEGIDEEGLLITVEDAHWMDEASTHLLHRLSEATKGRRWLLVATRRDAESGFDPAMGNRLELDPLDPEQTRALVIAATAATPLRPHDVDVIVQRSGGNPFFLSEIIRIVRDTGSTAALPDSLGSVVSTKIDGLSPLSRRVLRYCSVLGRSFRTAVVDKILSEESLALDEATRATLAPFLVEDGSKRLRFRHDMVRDVAYDGLSFKRRQAIHLRAGEVIQSMAGADRESVANVLAMHFSLGHAPGRAWEYGRIAGDRARESYANEDAAVQYVRALDAARQLDACPDRDLQAVWTHLGDVREQAGRFDEAFEAYRAATKLARDDAVKSAELRLKRARARERSGAYSTALREVTTGRRLITDVDTAEAAVTGARLLSFGAVIRQAQDRPREALAMAQTAAEAATTAGARGALARAYDVMDWAYHMTGRPDLAVYAKKALAIYEERGELAMQATEMSNLGAEAYFSGDWNEALDFYERAAAAALRAGNSALAAVVQSNAGEVWVNQGRIDDAVPVLRVAAQALRGSGKLDDAAFAEIQLARALCAQGSYAEAGELLDLAKQSAEEIGSPSIVLEAALLEADIGLWLDLPHSSLKIIADAEASAGEELAAFYRMNLARVRATALARTGQSAKARVVASAVLDGLGMDELDYDTALLMMTLAAIDGSDSETVGGDAAEAARFLERLGVKAAPVPLGLADQLTEPIADP